MTERPIGRNSSTGKLGLLWMVLAVVAMGGFMAWLAVNSPEPQAVAVVDEGMKAAGSGEFTPGQQVALDDIAAGPEAFVGREITLADVSVSSLLGETAFWVVSSKNIPFLIKLGDTLVAEGIKVHDGQVVTVVGPVRAMSAAVLDEWQRTGVLRSESDRQVAEYATAYLEATELKAGTAAKE